MMLRFGMHTLTRESQEVTVGVILPTKVRLATSEIFKTDIPHCGQLNSTTSALLTATKPGVSVKTKTIVVGVPRVVSSCLAHMSPSSPVSVGMFPSYTTLEVGSWQVEKLPPRSVTFEQSAVAEDPFTDIGRQVYRVGIH